MDPLFISSSSISAVAKCTLQGFLTKIHRVRLRAEYADTSTAYYAVAGKALHATRLHYLEHDNLSLALDLFDQEYLNYSNMSLSSASKYRYANLRELLTLWLPMASTPYELESAEIELTYQIDDYLIYTGRLDAILNDEHGVIHPYDLKIRTKDSTWWWNQWPLSPQLIGYTWLLQNCYPHHTVGNAILEMLEITELPATTKSCRTHGTKYAECRHHHINWTRKTYTYADTHVDTFLRNVKHYGHTLYDLIDTPLTALYTVPQTGPCTGACVFCDYLPLCKTRPNVGALDRWLEPNPEAPNTTPTTTTRSINAPNTRNTVIRPPGNR